MRQLESKCRVQAPCQHLGMDSGRKTETMDETVCGMREDGTKMGTHGAGWVGDRHSLEKAGERPSQRQSQRPRQRWGKQKSLFTTLEIKIGGRMSVEATKVARSTVWGRCSSMARGPAYHTQSPGPTASIGSWNVES